MASFLTKLCGRYQQKLSYSQESLEHTQSQSSQNIESEIFKLHNLQKGPSGIAVLRSEDALLYYKQIQCIRNLKNFLPKFITKKYISGYLSSDDQETYAVGVRAGMQSNDTVITSCRCHDWAIVMGESVHGVVAQLLGKATCNGGGGGSMYTYYKNLFGVENNALLGVGIGFAHKYNNNGAVSFTVFGDGNFNLVPTQHALKLAKLRNLPVVFIVENNNSKKKNSGDFYKQGGKMPGVRLDTIDLLAVREAAKFARGFAVERGPILLHLITEGNYSRSTSEQSDSGNHVEPCNDTKDPLGIFELLLTNSGLVEEKDLRKIEDETNIEIEAAFEKAKMDQNVDDKELRCDINAQCPHEIRNLWGL